VSNVLGSKKQNQTNEGKPQGKQQGNNRNQPGKQQGKLQVRIENKRQGKENDSFGKVSSRKRGNVLRNSQMQ